MSHWKNAISQQPIDFLPKFQDLQGKEFSTILENFTKIFSFIASRIIAFTIFYSVFRNFTEEMDSHFSRPIFKVVTR